MDPRSTQPVLEVKELVAGYGRRDVIYGVDLSVNEGEIIAVVGHNGAGKTTLLKAISGLVNVRSGSVVRAGEDVTSTSTASRVRRGLWYIPSERFVFGDLTVAETLGIGARYGPRDKDDRQRRLDNVFQTFPILKDRLKQKSGTMSGGQKRILSLALVLVAGPKLLLLDEPSLGLAPGLVHEVMDMVKVMASSNGLGVILVEQNIPQALRISVRSYVMRSGRITREALASELLKNINVWDLL